MIVCDRFHFIHIPKTGGKSVYAALSHFDQRRPKTWKGRIARRLGIPLHWTEARLRRHDDLAAAHRYARGIDSFTFAVVRDPYDHAVSHYRHLQTQNKDRRFADRSLTSSLPDFLEWRAAGAGLRGGRNLRFAQLPNQFFFVQRDGKLAVDRLLRLETIDSDFQALCRDLDLGEIELPRVNVNSTANPVDLDARSIRIINDLYAEDFEAFGYPMRSA